MSDLSLAALELDRKLDTLEVYGCRLSYDSTQQDADPVVLTRRGARMLSAAMGWSPLSSIV